MLEPAHLTADVGGAGAPRMLLAGALSLDVHSTGPLLILAAVIVIGALFGALAKRARLPSITGQVLAGVLMGKAGFDLFADEALHALSPVTDVALGLIAVTVGAHLNVKRLRNAGTRLLLLLVAEATLVPLFVIAAMMLVGRVELGHALLFGTVAIATAPATIVALVKESRARGVFVKTLIAAVAFNNLTCLFLFEIARAFAGGDLSSAGAQASTALSKLGLAAAIGAACAVGMAVAARGAVGGRRLTTAGVLSLLFAVGLARFLAISPLLACLFLGLVQTNLTPEKTKLVDTVFDDFEPVILAVFFTLAGMHLTFGQAGLVTVLTVAFFVARFAGKVVAANAAMRLAGAPRRVQRYLGVALVPQAGVAVALVVLIQESPTFAGFSDLFAAVVLSAVTANEIVGPLLTRWSLARAGEVGMDRSRLLDFLHEEHIVTGLTAATKEQAITQLVDLLASSSHLDRAARDDLLASVLTREADVSTCFGEGLAIPHGETQALPVMAGVLGLSKEGLPFETPDGKPVHCMLLLATPPDQRDRHLEVLAAISRTIGHDADVRARLFASTTAAHAYDILHDEEAEHFNYFLEEL